MGEDQQMWLLVTHRNMIVSSMLLLAHTHAHTHTLMPQDPFPDPPCARQIEHVRLNFHVFKWPDMSALQGR